MNNELRDRIYACWLGKSIGGTLGTPVEGCKEFMSLTFYPRIDSSGSLPNDDLDLQLVNLHAVEQHGIFTNANDIANEWVEHVRFPWDEYGYSLTNMRKGLKAPYCGYFDNPFTNCMGSPIRSEIWAVLANGNEKLAAYFAWQDAVVDHASGEGVYGEMFYAALETKALYSNGKDNVSLVKSALNCIPSVSRVYKAVADTVKWYEDGVGYPEIRDRIISAHGNSNFTDAPQNLAFSIVGLLYGTDFEDGMLKTVNLGYDTDCTVATLGSLYGLLYGTSFIPAKWSEPIGTKIAVSGAILCLDSPADIGELTDRCIALIESFAPLDKSRFVISDDEALDIKRQIYVLGGNDESKNIKVELRYDGECTVVTGERKAVYFDITNNSKWRVTLVPHFFIPNDNYRFDTDKLVLESGDKKKLTLTIDIDEHFPHIFTPVLKLVRLHDGQIWCSYDIPFTLIRAEKWIVDGEVKYIHGTNVVFDKKRADGIYTAEYCFRMPDERNGKLMAATVSPIKMVLDGAVVADEHNRNDYMPAYHRCPWSQCYFGILSAGMHRVKITLTDSEKLPDFRFAVLAPNETSEPGNLYAYIDAN